MKFNSILNKFLLFFGIKTNRWKLAICEIKNKRINILKILKPGFLEFWADPFLYYTKIKNIYFLSVIIIFQKR